MAEISWIRWRPLFRWNPFKPCMCCGKRLIGYWGHQGTAYVDAKQNWTFLCEACHEENADYWRDMWSDYYQGCM